MRIRHALRRLRETKDAVDNVARWAGYQSGNKFYARIRGYTGLRPAEIRALDDAAFVELLQLHLPLDRRVNRHAA